MMKPGPPTAEEEREVVAAAPVVAREEAWWWRRAGGPAVEVPGFARRAPARPWMGRRVAGIGVCGGRVCGCGVGRREKKNGANGPTPFNESQLFFSHLFCPHTAQPANEMPLFAAAPHPRALCLISRPARPAPPRPCAAPCPRLLLPQPLAASGPGDAAPPAAATAEDEEDKEAGAFDGLLPEEDFEVRVVGRRVASPTVAASVFCRRRRQPSQKTNEPCVVPLPLLPSDGRASHQHTHPPSQLTTST